MNLTERIKLGLTNNLGIWISSYTIYSKMKNEGYSSDAISRALEDISHTIPYGKVSVSSDDRKTLEKMGVRVGGTYYTKHNMTEEESRILQEYIDTF